jgi:hypothetical protein
MTDAKAVVEAGTLLDLVIADAQIVLAAREGKQPSETLDHLAKLLNVQRASTAREAWAKAFVAA